MKYPFIRDHRHRFRVRALCRALRVSRSGYYASLGRPLSQRARQNACLLAAICKIHRRARQAYGVIKTWHALKDEGIDGGHNRVARLRRTHGMEARRCRRFRLAYAARQSAPAAPNLLDRDFAVSAPDRVWAGNITFVATREGGLYLAVLIDLYARNVVGWAMSERHNRRLAVDALVMAIERRCPAPGLIHHSDQGILYASAAYREILAVHHMLPRMSRKGSCYDNACVESFFSGLKNELIWNRDFRTRAEARRAILEWIEVFHNRERLHQTLDYVSPVRYEERTVAP